MAAYQQGDRGEAVKIIQRALAAAGFNVGAIDGVFGPKTAAAVRAAQAAKGLPQTGIADHPTQNAIGIGTPNDGGGGGSTQDQIAAKLRSQYPQLAWTLNVPELAPIVARMDQMEPAEFQAAIYASDWYKTHQSSIREAEAQRNVDPATYDSRINELSTHITNLAGQMGVEYSGARQLAEQALRLNWSEEQIRTALAASAGAYPGSDSAGGIYSVKNQVKQLAMQYAVPFSDQSAWEWAKRIEAGSATLQDMTPYFLNYAKSLYPQLSKALDSGITVADYAAPYAQIAAQELGINPADIRWDDPRWNRALVSTNEAGERAPMDLQRWTSEIRNNPMYGWDKTPAARNQAAQFAHEALSTFGLVA
jgi:peptidoglycan hydrolase-like protein with peptidoglycan-binding domain